MPLPHHWIFSWCSHAAVAAAAAVAADAAVTAAAAVAASAAVAVAASVVATAALADGYGQKMAVCAVVHCAMCACITVYTAQYMCESSADFLCLTVRLHKHATPQKRKCNRFSSLLTFV